MAIPDAFVLFVDDVRQEVGNKTSYMGAYGTDLVFDETHGTVLLRLVVTTFLQWHTESPPDGWFLHVQLPTESPPPISLPPEGAPILPDQDSGLVRLTVQVVVVQLPLSDGTRIEVALVKDEERKLLGFLNLKRATAASTP
jgi:hypothetical protein